MSEMGNKSTSQSAPPEIVNRKANVSVNEKEKKSIQLTYRSVGSASKGNCSFTWQSVNGGYRGEMRAQDGNTMYWHDFAKEVPEDIKRKLGGPSKSRVGDAVIFTFSRPDPSVSLQPYVKKE